MKGGRREGARGGFTFSNVRAAQVTYYVDVN